MMEELVTLHSEFVQLYGRTAEAELPPWLENVPLQEGQAGGKRGGEHWHRLYSTADIRACMGRVHGLRYEEIANINGFLKIKPSSSGFGIGSCNWVIKGTHRSLTYISTSILSPNHATPLDLLALGSCEVLLLSNVEAPNPLLEESAEVKKEGAISIPGNRTLDSKVVQTASSETQQVTEGATVQKQTNQRHSASPASSLSPAPVGSAAGNSGSTQKPSSSMLVPVTSEKLIKTTSDEQEVPKQSTSLTVDATIKAVCRSGVEAVGAGGSVLFPVSFYGSFLEIIEEMSTQLRSAGIEVPMYYVSPVAEEVLAYVNTVPEWLCPARQEKLYAGEALFGHVEAVQEKRLHHFSALHNLDLLRCWQEPCVVFATHWSLRVGSALQLLQRWRNNPLCLLILTEPNVDANLLLEPFEPYAIQVLHQPILSSLTSREVTSIIQTLKPRLSLVPESFKGLESSSRQGSVPGGEVLCYKSWQLYKVPRFQYDLEVEMSADLALQIQLKQIKSGKVAAARLSADLHVKDGRWSLDLPSPSSYCGGSLRSLPRHQIRWGKVDVDSLLTAFKERQMYDVYVTERTMQDDQSPQDKRSNNEIIIEITSPSAAKIEISSTRINVHANEPGLRRLIVEVLKSALNVL
ncbi:integrator complex subunit 9 [Marchantia polymorpha subsp. ruderalis]